MPESLPPIVGNNPRLLILGSMPGKRSLESKEYYKHPQNRFWRILFDYFLQSMPAEDYSARKKLLTDNGIALWDILKYCERKNKDGKETSSDGDITHGIANKIEDLIHSHNIRAVFLNGTKAAAEYKKYFSHLAVTSELLYSTSPRGLNDSAVYTQWKNKLKIYFNERHYNESL